MPLFLVEYALEPKRGRRPQDREDFRVAMNRLAAEDESGFDISSDIETGQTIVRCVSEQQCQHFIELLERKFGIAVTVGPPHASYRETPGNRVEIDYTHKKVLGTSGQFARIRMVVEPGEAGSGYLFADEIAGDAVPKEFTRGISRALDTARMTGVLAGFPVIDFKIVLTGGAFHDVDSSAAAFEIAARGAFIEGLAKAQCKLLEPIMKLEVTVPNDCVSAVVRDLEVRRARKLMIDPCRVDALVPLGTMFGYANALDELTAKQGMYVMAFDRFAPVPSSRDDGPFRPAMGMRA